VNAPDGSIGAGEIEQVFVAAGSSFVASSWLKNVGASL
jgi:hypothetical protein